MLPHWIRNLYAQIKSWFRPISHNCRKFFIYLILPLLVVATFLKCAYLYDNDGWVDNAGTIFQMFAITIGGLWAYRSFNSEKRFENLRNVHIIVREYDQYLGDLCNQYRSGSLNVVGFKLALMPKCQDLKMKIIYTYALPPSLKRKILNTIYSSVIKSVDGANFGKVIDKYEKSIKSIDNKIRFLLEQFY